MNFKVSIFPAKLSWPDAIDNLDQADNNEKTVRIVANPKNFDSLMKFQGLRRLWCFDINAKQLEIICNCKSIEQLYIENLKTDKLSKLSTLPELKILSIDTCTKVTTIDDIGDLTNLKGLSLIHFSKIKDIKPLAMLKALKELAVAGSMWTRMKIKSFEPLAKLRDVEFLHLTNIKPDDESLKSLENLNKLKQLDIANFYPMEDFARLAGIHSKTNCTWFKPYIDTFSPCKKCGRETIVMLTGKRKPSICSKCDVKRLNKHVAEFEKIMRDSAQPEF